MKRVEFARYYLPGRAGRKPYASSWKMTAEDAAARGALGQVPGTAEIREVPETDAERARALTFYQSAGHDSVQPPRQNAAMDASLTPGRYRFYDDYQGAPPQEVEIADDAGQLVVRFPATEDDDGAELLLADMLGRFEPVR